MNAKQRRVEMKHRKKRQQFRLKRKEAAQAAVGAAGRATAPRR